MNYNLRIQLSPLHPLAMSVISTRENTLTSPRVLYWTDVSHRVLDKFTSRHRHLFQWEWRENIHWKQYSPVTLLLFDCCLANTDIPAHVQNSSSNTKRPSSKFRARASRRSNNSSKHSNWIAPRPSSAFAKTGPLRSRMTVVTRRNASRTLFR